MGEYMRQMWNGPGHLRFFIQPALAILLGIIDGIRDAKAGRPPYILGLIRNPGHEPHRFRELFERLTVPLVLAIALNVVFQLIIRGGYHPLPTIGYAVVFIAFPYCASRALSNRVATRRRHRSAHRRRLEA
jgi:hypothetical protein